MPHKLGNSVVARKYLKLWPSCAILARSFGQCIFYTGHIFSKCLKVAIICTENIGFVCLFPAHESALNLSLRAATGWTRRAASLTELRDRIGARWQQKPKKMQYKWLSICISFGGCCSQFGKQTSSLFLPKLSSFHWSCVLCINWVAKRFPEA